MYILVSSLDSRDLYPENSYSDFTVELHRGIDTRTFEIALIQVFGVSFPGNQLFYIFSPVCQTSLVSGEERDLLGQFYEFGSVSNPIYNKFAQESVKRIRFSLRTPQIETPRARNKAVIYLTLHLRDKHE